MNKPLTYADIKIGHWYKVVATPKHLLGMGKYPWFNMTGVAIWSDERYNLVNIRFGGCKERGIPPECLEVVAKEPMIIDCAHMPSPDSGDGLRLLYENLARERIAEEQKAKGMVTQETAKVGQLYRITKVPNFWERISVKQKYPSLGAVGRLIHIHAKDSATPFGTLRLADGKQRFVPFDCMEMVTIRIPPLSQEVININDDELIKKMVENPMGTLKIIKGLAKMNRDYRLRAFLDKGVIF